jgi:hypothetical protein
LVYVDPSDASSHPDPELIRDENGIATGGLAYRVEVHSDVQTSDRTT